VISFCFFFLNFWIVPLRVVVKNYNKGKEKRKKFRLILSYDLRLILWLRAWMLCLVGKKTTNTTNTTKQSEARKRGEEATAVSFSFFLFLFSFYLFLFAFCFLLFSFFFSLSFLFLSLFLSSFLCVFFFFFLPLFFFFPFCTMDFDEAKDYEIVLGETFVNDGKGKPKGKPKSSLVSVFCTFSSLSFLPFLF